METSDATKPIDPGFVDKGQPEQHRGEADEVDV
jgi:hypothetical protein